VRGVCAVTVKNLTDRIAALFVKVAAATMRSDETMVNRAGRFSSAPLHAAIARLAFQVAKQGLAPEDFDRPNGRDALHAIAAAIPPKKTNAVTSFLPLPDEWKHVVNAAQRQADRAITQAQR
jgi:hypothetical protein